MTARRVDTRGRGAAAAWLRRPLGPMTAQHALVLKLVAVVTMTADHLGYVYDVEILRAVGRFAFIAFAAMFTVGYRRTSDRGRYLVRLLVFAVLAQPPYMLLFDHPGYQLNILFTFAVAFGLLHALESRRVWLVVLLSPLTLIVEYSIYGIAVIVLMHLLRRHQLAMVLAVAALTALCFTVVTDEPRQLLAAAATPLVLALGRIRATARMPRYTLYWFCPLHLLVLAGLDAIT